MGTRRILGVYISHPGDLNAGIPSLYKEFDTIKEFIEFSENEINRTDIGCSQEPSFEDCIQWWTEDDSGRVGFIHPEYCERHKKFWGKQVPRTDIDDCPDCWDEVSGKIEKSAKEICDIAKGVEGKNTEG